jgi:hypothetical protein
MKFFKIALYPVLLATFVCCTFINMGYRSTPHYHEVDPEIVPYVDAYLYLANLHGLTFHHKINVGFKDTGGDVKTPDGLVSVGVSNRGLWFREIDIDSKYWRYFTKTSQMSLVWHELTHSYCGRGHDYGDGKEYGEDGREALNDPSKRGGFFEDNCPISLMFPIVVSDLCFNRHMYPYIEDMFQRCEIY